MVLATEYPFLDILWTMIIFFGWVIWFWTLVMVLSDVFRRDDFSGWSKALWTVFVIFLPFLGVLVYLIAHGKELGERRMREADHAMRSSGYVPAAENGTAQIAEAKKLLDSGAITPEEFAQLKARALS
jgi:Phospholipase_D-nuclease N-terminal/Short C-terminal domain